jgi:hypothetical protein
VVFRGGDRLSLRDHGTRLGAAAAA